MKVNSKIYKGIEYIQLNELPEMQQKEILTTLDQEVLIKILVDGKILTNCLQYKDYESWFDTTYKLAPRVLHKEVENVRSLALNEA